MESDLLQLVYSNEERPRLGKTLALVHPASQWYSSYELPTQALFPALEGFVRVSATY